MLLLVSYFPAPIIHLPLSSNHFSDLEEFSTFLKGKRIFVNDTLEKTKQSSNSFSRLNFLLSLRKSSQTCSFFFPRVVMSQIFFSSPNVTNFSKSKKYLNMEKFLTVFTYYWQKLSLKNNLNIKKFSNIVLTRKEN